MELINNTTKTLKNDLSVEIKQGSKLSIAAACFSIYAFQELKEQLSQIEELRFKKLLKSIKDVCDLADFEIEGRVVLIDKRSGRVWR